MKSSFWFYGYDDGDWEHTNKPVLGGEYDWELAPAMSSENRWRNFSVEGATETHKGLQRALCEIVSLFPELSEWIMKFDGPWLPVCFVLSLPSFSWARTVFFHGTTTAAWDSILKNGLCPRTMTGAKAAYGAEIGAGEGNPDLLYLTTQTNLAKFAARDAARAAGKPFIVSLVGVEGRFAEPDEDSKTASARESLDRLGSIGYRKCVSADLISPRWVLEQGDWQEAWEDDR